MKQSQKYVLSTTWSLVSFITFSKSYLVCCVRLNISNYFKTFYFHQHKLISSHDVTVCINDVIFENPIFSLCYLSFNYFELWPQCYKAFYMIRMGRISQSVFVAFLLQITVFVLGRLFQPSLKFANKATAHSGAPLGQVLALPVNIILGQKSMQVSTTLPYLVHQ